MENLIEHIQLLGPFFIGVWAVTLLCTFLRPQRYANSLMLMFALAVSMIFVAGFFGENAAVFLLVCFLIAMLALLIVPVLLIMNGITMIKRESVSLAHLLSLGLGIVIGVGEIATIFYVLGFVYHGMLGYLNDWVLLLSFTVFYFSVLILCFVFYSVFIEIIPHRMNFNYVIIHGCGLIGGERLTKILQNRVDKAIEIYRKCKVKPMIIPSGG